MTREETVRIIRIMVDSYPNYKPNNLSETVDVWNMMLEEYSYQQVSMALKSYILSDTSGFAPAIGQLVDKIHSMTQPEQLNEMEAWALVAKAISNSGYNSIEEYSALPPAVQKAVGSPNQLREWALTEYLNKEVVMSNFIKSYRIECKREQELAKMPSDVRRLIDGVNQNSYKAQIEDKRQRQETLKKLDDRLKAKTKPLDDVRECVPMPERIKKRLEELRNGKIN